MTVIKTDPIVKTCRVSLEKTKWRLGRGDFSKAGVTLFVCVCGGGGGMQSGKVHSHFLPVIFKDIN